MKSLHHAFNILEKPGFRSLPKIEHPEQSQGNTRAKMYGVTGITGATDLHKGGNKLNMIKCRLE